MIKLSSGRSVGLCVARSVGASVCPVHCGKNGESDPDAVWHHTSDGSRNEACMCVGIGHRSTRRGTFGGEFGAPHCNHVATLRRTRATVPQPSELPFGVVRTVGRWAEALLY